ncbi:17.5 kDa class I heat shock protein [Spatholobus suberectus]|nr:17.5 kDa class I heat shock protein [Spatholobus suberectus]
MSLIPSFFGGRRSDVFDPFSLDVWDPFKDFHFPTSLSAENSAFVSTRVDWKETPEAHVFKADIPGLKKEEVKVQIEGDKASPLGPTHFATPSAIGLGSCLVWSVVGVARSNVLDPFSLDVWDPFKDLPFPNSLSNSFPQFSRENSAFVSTRVDWKETPEAHVFKADIPGLKKEEVKVEIEDDRVAEKENKNIIYNLTDLKDSHPVNYTC